jgi:hypothetical protein
MIINFILALMICFGQNQSDLPSDFSTLQKMSVEEFALKTQSHKQAWGSGKIERWDLSQNTGELFFSLPNGIKAVCPAQIIGTYNSEVRWLRLDGHECCLNNEQHYYEKERFQSISPAGQTRPTQVSGQRIAPSSLLKCPRDHLTSFMGRVTNYQRTQTRISIRVRTDEETTKNFTIKFTRNDDPTRLFLLRGEEFKRSDLKLIEVSTGRLRPTMRAIIWVCDDGSQPVIDWRPPEK